MTTPKKKVLITAIDTAAFPFSPFCFAQIIRIFCRLSRRGSFKPFMTCLPTTVSSHGININFFSFSYSS